MQVSNNSCKTTLVNAWNTSPRKSSQFITSQSTAARVDASHLESTQINASSCRSRKSTQFYANQQQPLQINAIHASMRKCIEVNTSQCKSTPVNARQRKSIWANESPCKSTQVSESQRRFMQVNKNPPKTAKIHAAPCILIQGHLSRWLNSDTSRTAQLYELALTGIDLRVRFTLVYRSNDFLTRPWF